MCCFPDCNCSRFSVDATREKNDRGWCDRECKSAGGLLASPTSNEEYQCLVLKAGGTDAPLWTGMVHTPLGLVDEYSSRRVDNFGYKGPGSDQYGVTQSNSTGDCVYVFGNQYSTAGCSAKPNRPVYCACTKSTSRTSCIVLVKFMSRL